jgi:hypothetical protein
MRTGASAFAPRSIRFEDSGAEFRCKKAQAVKTRWAEKWDAYTIGHSRRSLGTDYSLVRVEARARPIHMG